MLIAMLCSGYRRAHRAAHEHHYTPFIVERNDKSKYFYCCDKRLLNGGSVSAITLRQHQEGGGSFRR
jgi:hypothetical protein